RDGDDQDLRRRVPVDAVLDAPAAGIRIGIAGDFRHRGGDPRLLGRIEAECAGDLPRPLPGRDDVVFVMNAYRQQPDAHPRASRATTTVTSSRRREKSRYSTAAIRAGCRSRSPGYGSSDQ